ncbi:MAG: hypothetical protein MI974_15665 [Chitinophagales bacterium]|nr:hypothetical protein [Chitinophagales bacterium]
MRVLTISLAFLLLATFSCKQSSDSETQEAESSPTSSLMPDAERHFLYAWLADCVNDNLQTTDSLSALQNLNGIALNRIQAATIRDANITNRIGKHTIIWGPVVAIHSPESGAYTSKNMVYCLAKDNGAGKTPEYVIGIAGTNPLSAYDWFQEDLRVGTSVQGPSNWNPDAKISLGTSIALNEIKSLKNAKGQALYTVLDALAGSGATISVSGHSLGGALTQALSYDLKLRYKINEVQAWVYAGPTAGDSTFAATLTTTLGSGNYNAYNNTIDLVPHAWQKDKLNELCTIYNGLKFKKWKVLSECSTETIEEVPTIDGVIQYLKDISAQVNYALPTPISTFTGGELKMDFEDCTKYNSAIDALWKAGTGTEYYNSLNSITKSCSGDKILYNQFEKLFAYLTEMGYQHTTAYFDHFFKDESSDFQTAVQGYVPGMAKDSWENWFDSGSEAFDDALDPFLLRVANHLKPGSTCGCN